jgi:hypothetical protein
MRIFLILNGIILLCIGLTGLNAQETVTTSGGKAMGSGGTVSYSVGQTLYTNQSSDEGSVDHGVQQPYEISVVSGIEDTDDITLTFLAYPNPTSHVLTLKIGNYQSEQFYYRLFDLKGRLLEVNRLIDGKTTIHIGEYPPAMYLVKIYDNQQEIKVFKIIKN